MSSLNLNQRVDALIKLGRFIGETLDEGVSAVLPESFSQQLLELIETTQVYNPWFIPPYVRLSLRSLADSLSAEALVNWISFYDISNDSNKKVAVILPGNIPLAGFHDMLCVLITGGSFIGKISSKENKLLPFIADVLIAIEPGFNEKIKFTEGRMSGFDAVIASGSNNSSPYFNFYFGKYPNIIRKHRNGVAVLNGNESPESLNALMDDIFLYFGLGCRNVSKIYVPAGYNLEPLWLASFKYQARCIDHNKYMNNYNYYRTIYLMKQEPFLENGFWMMKEEEAIASAVSVVFYEFYDDLKQVIAKLEKQKEEIQCVLSEENIPGALTFGKAQFPELTDYADGVDTIKFLIG